MQKTEATGVGEGFTEDREDAVSYDSTGVGGLLEDRSDWCIDVEWWV